MRRLPLSGWLVVLTVGVVVLVAGALAPVALRLIERLAEENARARVRLASLGAAEVIESRATEMVTAAGLLAERPTLTRLLVAGESAELVRYLDRYRSTGGLAGVAVWRDGSLLAASPSDLPRHGFADPPAAKIGLAPPLPGERWALAVGAAELPALEGTYTLVFERLDESVARGLSEQMGVEVRIRTAVDPGWTAEQELGWYRAVTAVESAVSVEALLPRSEVDRTVAPLRRSFISVTGIACLLAVVAGGLVGRRLARPLEELRQAAARIGEGDLTTPIPNAPGREIAALTSSMEDMRRRLRTLTGELRHREAEAHALLSGIVEGVFAVDEERRIQYLNEQAEVMLGVTAREVVGRFCGDVLQPAGAGHLRPCEDHCPIIHARSRGSSRAVEHLQLVGGRRTVVVTSAPPTGARQVQVLRDETETEAARRSRDAVLANVSHELKTPLSAQLASIELLQDGLDGMRPEAARGLIQSLERSTLRLVRLVDNLLESVRIETGQATRQRLPVHLEEVVSEAIALTRPLFDQKGQHIHVELAGDPPEMVGDPGQITQVLVNLLANAQRFAPDDSTIVVGGARDEDAFRLWVEDPGPGVPPALSTSIFDRFHRGGREGQGMGLGLWIAKSIVERHGGRIGVSPAASGGARFTITFPGPVVAA